MNPVLRLVAFLALLAALFAGGVALGRAVPPVDGDRPAVEQPAHGAPGGEMPAGETPEGHGGDG